MNNDFWSWTLKIFPFLVKAFAVVVGAIFALVLSEDIDENGNIRISLIMMTKFAFSITIGATGLSSTAPLFFFHIKICTLMDEIFSLFRCR